MWKAKELLKRCYIFSTTVGKGMGMGVTTKKTHTSQSQEQMLSKSREEAVSHWKYVKGVLVNSGASVDTIEVAGFHYISAFEHGYGHGAEDQATGRIKFEHKL